MVELANSRKVVKRAFLVVARTLGLFWLARRITARAVRILCYHGIWMAESGFTGDALFMDPNIFELRLQLLETRGYPVISLDAAISGLSGAAKLPNCATVITVDDGWYSTFAYMTPSLHERGWPATLYCDSAHLQDGLPIAHMMAEYIHLTAPPEVRSRADPKTLSLATNHDVPMLRRLTACRELAGQLGVDFDRLVEKRAFGYMLPAELEDAARRGLNVELHTHSHTIHDGSPEAVAREIAENRATLAAWLNRSADSFQHFCYPSGRFSDGALKALGAAGLRSATTTHQGLAWPGTDLLLLPRLIDNGRHSHIEFEAEISGFMELWRLLRRASWPFPRQAPD